MDEFSIYRRFPNIQLAKEVNDLLLANGIKTAIGDNSAPVDITFTGNTLQDQIEIRIAPADFQKADELLQDQARQVMQDLDPDYYLHNFSDDELYDILLKPDEWNDFDYVLAQHLLNERGKSIDQEQLDALRKQRIQDLAKPEKGQRAWIIAGYVFSFMGGFLGIIIGYFLWNSRKTLPNGEKVYSYGAKDRKHGLNILLIGIIVFPLSILIRAFSGIIF